jgi:hypothetical protein
VLTQLFKGTSMKRAFFILANAMALWGAAPASSAPAATAPATSVPAQTNHITSAPGWTVPAAPAPAATASAPFGCDARAPNVCHFRIFYTRGDRNVVLPAGMKSVVPGVIIGGDLYCVSLGKAPMYKCARKAINDKYNS